MKRPEPVALYLVGMNKRASDMGYPPAQVAYARSILFGHGQDLKRRAEELISAAGAVGCCNALYLSWRLNSDLVGNLYRAAELGWIPAQLDCSTFETTGCGRVYWLCKAAIYHPHPLFEWVKDTAPSSSDAWFYVGHFLNRRCRFAGQDILLLGTTVTKNSTIGIGIMHAIKQYRGRCARVRAAYTAWTCVAQRSALCSKDMRIMIAQMIWDGRWTDGGYQN